MLPQARTAPGRRGLCAGGTGHGHLGQGAGGGARPRTLRLTLGSVNHLPGPHCRQLYNGRNDRSTHRGSSRGFSALTYAKTRHRGGGVRVNRCCCYDYHKHAASSRPAHSPPPLAISSQEPPRPCPGGQPGRWQVGGCCLPGCHTTGQVLPAFGTGISSSAFAVPMLPGDGQLQQVPSVLRV